MSSRPNWLFSIVGGTTQYLDEDMEPDAIQIIDFSYNIIAHLNDGREESKEKAGDLSGFVLEVDGKDDLFEAADAHSQTAYDVWELVYGGKRTQDGFYSPRFIEALGRPKDELMCGRVVHIDMVTVLPKFRGQRVALRAIWGALNVHEGRLVTLNAFPLQLSKSKEVNAQSELQLGKFNQDWDKSTKKLQEYYALMGFKQVKPVKTDVDSKDYSSWMYIDNEYTRPHLYDLVPSLEKASG